MKFGEDRCSGNAHYLRILLKIISTEIISISVILTSFWSGINLLHPLNLLFFWSSCVLKQSLRSLF